MKFVNRVIARLWGKKESPSSPYLEYEGELLIGPEEVEERAQVEEEDQRCAVCDGVGEVVILSVRYYGPSSERVQNLIIRCPKCKRATRENVFPYGEDSTPFICDHTIPEGVWAYITEWDVRVPKYHGFLWFKPGTGEKTTINLPEDSLGYLDLIREAPLVYGDYYEFWKNPKYYREGLIICSCGQKYRVITTTLYFRAYDARERARGIPCPACGKPYDREMEYFCHDGGLFNRWFGQKNSRTDLWG